MLFLDSLFGSACLGALFASIASGTVGPLVVVKRIVFIAGSISHSILGGMGFCLWLQRAHGAEWASLSMGALASALLSALAIGWTHLRYRQREDAIISALWSTGMAIGIICLSLTPGNNVEMVEFLFGNILWITSKDLLLLASLDLLLLVIISWKYKKILAICFDPEQALLQNVRVQGLYLLLLSLIAIAIVLLVQMVGTILVLALLTLPATCASLFTKRLFTLMALSTLLATIFSIGGISLSFAIDWPPGATISLLAALSYLAALGLKSNPFLKRFAYRNLTKP